MYVYCLYRRYMREKELHHWSDFSNTGIWLPVWECPPPRNFWSGYLFAALPLCPYFHVQTYFVHLLHYLSFFLFKWRYDWQECSRCIFRVCFLIVLQEVVIPTEMQSRWMLSFTNVSSIFFFTTKSYHCSSDDAQNTRCVKNRSPGIELCL